MNNIEKGLLSCARGWAVLAILWVLAVVVFGIEVLWMDIDLQGDCFWQFKHYIDLGATWVSGLACLILGLAVLLDWRRKI